MTRQRSHTPAGAVAVAASRAARRARRASPAPRPPAFRRTPAPRARARSARAWKRQTIIIQTVNYIKQQTIITTKLKCKKYNL